MISLALVCKVILDLLEYFKGFMDPQIFLGKEASGLKLTKSKSYKGSFLRQGICSQDLLIGKRKEALS